MSDIMKYPEKADRQEVPQSHSEEYTNIMRKPISSTLRSLKVGDVAVFPIEQRTSVLIVANRIKKECSRTGWNYIPEDNEDDFTISITRIN